MRRTKRSGSFILCLLVNMLLNPEWSIPAWILLGLHVWRGINLWWFAGAVAVWIARLLLGMWLVSWGTKCGNQKTPVRENKNPYSAKGRDESRA